MNLNESIKSAGYVKSHMSEILEHITDKRNRIVITHNGEARAVLQDIKSYEQMQESLAMLKMLAMSTRSMEQGKGHSLKKAFSDVRKRAQKTCLTDGS